MPSVVKRLYFYFIKVNKVSRVSSANRLVFACFFYAFTLFYKTKLSVSVEPVVNKTDLIKIMKYDKEKGGMVWTVIRGSTVRPGKIVGTPNLSGRLQASVNGERRWVSDLVWIWHTGEDPKELGFIIDYKNGISSDDRIENLRKSSFQEKYRNRALRSDSKSGIKGVHKSEVNFTASIMKDGFYHYLGTYETKEEAGAAYKAASILLFGEFASTFRNSEN